MLRPSRPSGPVLVVDPDEAVRQMVTDALGHVGYPTREASSGEDALAQVRDEPPGMVILEVSLPGTCGYEVCRALRQEFGDMLPIVFISGERTKSFDKVAGFLVGGDDYLVKPFALDEFVARVRRLVERSSPLGQGAATLTRREVEVLGLLAEGMSQTEIAHRLFVTPKTAGTHTERIFKKLGVHSRAQAIALVFREGLFERESREAHPPGAVPHH
jgi:DNA-binding NarL/FixJ family response regulator